jgi:hypothetical protein
MTFTRMHTAILQYCILQYCNTAYCNTAILQYCNTAYCNTAYCNTAILHTAILQYCILQYCNTAYCNTQDTVPILNEFLSLNYERYLYKNKIGRNTPLLKWFIKSVQIVELCSTFTVGFCRRSYERFR